MLSLPHSHLAACAQGASMCLKQVRVGQGDHTHRLAAARAVAGHRGARRAQRVHHHRGRRVRPAVVPLWGGALSPLFPLFESTRSIALLFC